MIQDLSGSWCIKEIDESTLIMDSSVPLMHHDPDRSWITNPDLDHPKGTHVIFSREAPGYFHCYCSIKPIDNIVYEFSTFLSKLFLVFF